MLRPLARLTKSLQSRQLDLPGAFLLLQQTCEELTNIAGLSDAVALLRTDLVRNLRTRITQQESAWLGFLKLGVEYPDQVVTTKFGLLQERLSQIDWQCTPNDFLSDYKKFRQSIRTLLDNGTDPNLKGIIDALAADLDMGRAWFMYRCLTRVLSPTSAEDGRTFSCLSRLRTKFRRRLHIHLSACVRVSQANVLGRDSLTISLWERWSRCGTPPRNTGRGRWDSAWVPRARECAGTVISPLLCPTLMGTTWSSTLAGAQRGRLLLTWPNISGLERMTAMTTRVIGICKPIVGDSFK